MRLISLLIGFFLPIKICFVGILRGFRFHPFARVKGGQLSIELNSSIRRVGLDSSRGKIFIKSNSWLNDGVELSAIELILIGCGTTLQRNVTINGQVTLGAGCLVAPNVFISSTSHVHDMCAGLSIREQESRLSWKDFCDRYNKPVLVGDDVWIGVNAVIMPGVSIGSHAIIGANSVVTGDVPVGAIVVGVPARILKYRVGFEG